MNDARHARPFLEAFDRAIADLYAQHDGLRVNVLYTYEMPDLESDHFIFHIEEEVLAGGARGVLEAFEQALLEEVGDALVADIVAVDDVRLTRYKAALAVEATDAAALAPLREGTFVCTVTDDAGNPIAGSRVSIDLEGGGRIVGGRVVETDAGGKAAFVYEAASTPGDVVFHIRAANLLVTMEGYVRVPRDIEHDAPERVERLSATRITYHVVDAEGILVGGMEVGVRLHAGVGQIVDEEPYRDGRGAFTYMAKHTPGGAIFEIRAGARSAHIPVAVH